MSSAFAVLGQGSEGVFEEPFEVDILVDELRQLAHQRDPRMEAFYREIHRVSRGNLKGYLDDQVEAEGDQFFCGRYAIPSPIDPYEISPRRLFSMFVERHEDDFSFRADDLPILEDDVTRYLSLWAQFRKEERMKKGCFGFELSRAEYEDGRMGDLSSNERLVLGAVVRMVKLHIRNAMRDEMRKVLKRRDRQSPHFSIGRDFKDMGEVTCHASTCPGIAPHIGFDEMARFTTPRRTDTGAVDLFSFPARPQLGWHVGWNLMFSQNVYVCGVPEVPGYECLEGGPRLVMWIDD